MKYKIEFQLDSRCNDILDTIQREKEEFVRILERGLSVKKITATSAHQDIVAKLSEGFARRLTKLQVAAVHHLLTVRHGANFSVPGSGKTTIALAYYYLLRRKNLVDAVLVIGPGSCFEPWEHEYRICFGKKLNGVRLAGNNKARRHELCLLADQYEFLLTTYHSAARDVGDLSRTLSRRKYLLILDESHYVKRPHGGKLVEAVLGLAEYAERRVILTGTPMPNGLPDLWSQLTFLWFDQKPLGLAEDFLRDVQRKETHKAVASVRRRISPLFFRITKSQLDLPRPSFKNIKCQMSPLQLRIYSGIAARFLTQVKESPVNREVLRDWRRARAVRLLQVASNPTLLRQRCEEFQLPAMDIRGLALQEAIEHYAQYEIPNKISAACSLAREICGRGEKVIIWSTFVHNLEMLANQVNDLSPVVVHGGVPVTALAEEDFSREVLISKFRDDRSCKVLIANPAACAESISLHSVCHHAIYLDRSFNCAHYLQSLDRIHRLGLSEKQETYYYLLQSRDSIDEVVDSRLKKKMRTMKDVIEADLPGKIPGYWSEDLGDEEEMDLQMVEQHIKSLRK
ncbi:MAG: SNF2-related protein [Sulfuricaulis sp.]|uniref:DEAD/DEAH box helicase n=1 Tax=Sulfuricaulis sp. TaxID=2003553 RepID=UPI0034A5280F